MSLDGMWEGSAFSVLVIWFDQAEPASACLHPGGVNPDLLSLVSSWVGQGQGDRSDTGREHCKISLWAVSHLILGIARWVGWDTSLSSFSSHETNCRCPHRTLRNPVSHSCCPCAGAESPSLAPRECRLNLNQGMPYRTTGPSPLSSGGHEN